MSVKDRTRKLLADTLEQMLLSTSLEDIHVSDLCEKCGVHRQTFYYHFKDKYELVAWIYAQDVKHSLEGTSSFRQQVTKFLEICRQNRAFYARALQDNGQNSLHDYIVNEEIEGFEEELKELLHVRTLSPDLYNAVVFNAHGFYGVFSSWIRGKNGYSPEELAKYVIASMPPLLKEAYETGKDPGNQVLKAGGVRGTGSYSGMSTMGAAMRRQMPSR